MRHLRLVIGGGGIEQPRRTMAANLLTRRAPMPRWQIVMAVVSKIVLLLSLYYLIRG